MKPMTFAVAFAATLALGATAHTDEIDNIVTVVGGGTDTGNASVLALRAHLEVPSAVAFDSEGRLYIAETSTLQFPPNPWQQRVRRVDLETGLITTVAGTGQPGPDLEDIDATTARITAPVRVALDREDNLYIAGGSLSNRIQKVDRQTGHIVTVVGNGDPCPVPSGPCGDTGTARSAWITSPNRGAVFDHSGNFYFSDPNRIRKVTAWVIDGVPQALDGTEIVDNFAGTGVAGGTGEDVDAKLARLSSPRGLEVDRTGENLYIADLSNHRIRAVSFATGRIRTVVGTGEACSPATDPCGDGLQARAARIINPTNVVFDSLGNLYINQSNHRVRKVDPSGIISTIAGTGIAGFAGDGGPATAALLNMGRGAGMDAANNFYLADAANGRIRRLNLATPVTVDPDTLAIAHSRGAWVTAYVSVPEGWLASEVNVGSVRLQAIDPSNGAVRLSSEQETLQAAPAPGSPSAVLDGNRLMVKFDRETVASWAIGAPELVLRVEGRFLGGRYFSGDTPVRTVTRP